MSYLNIPAATDTLAVSQGQIQTNFALINVDVGRNHVPMTDTTVINRGRHKFVEYLVQTIDPVPAGAAAGDSYLYTKDVAGVTQLFWQRVGDTPVQMTEANPVPAAIGFTFLPGKLLLQWGTLSMPFTDGSQSALIPFTPNFSAAPFAINATVTRSLSNTPLFVGVKDTSVTAIDFRLFGRGGTGNHDVYWTAIGPA